MSKKNLRSLILFTLLQRRMYSCNSRSEDWLPVVLPRVQDVVNFIADRHVVNVGGLCSDTFGIVNRMMFYYLLLIVFVYCLNIHISFHIS
jgi:hypothetical protein